MSDGFTTLRDDPLGWILDVASDAIVVRRLEDLRLVGANRAYADLMGVPLERLPGTTPSEVGIVDTDGHGRWLASLSGGGIQEVESDLVLARGVRRVHVTARVADVGGVPCSVSLIRDITDVHQASRALEREEANLRSAEERYRTLVEQIPAVVYVDAAVGPDTTIYISPQTEAILGFTQQEWMTDPHLLSKHVHPDDQARWREAMERADATGEPVLLEYRIVRADGDIVWVHDRAVLIREGSGAPMLWQGVMFDITDRRAAEDALREAFERERTASARLRALDDMKNTFLEAVSHELRTPLTAILGAALTLERQDLDLSKEETRDLMGGLATNARKLHRLLGDLLDLDRLGRGIIEPNLRRTDLAALVRGVLEESQPLGGRTVTTDLDEAFIELDGPKVERIVENLVANAARHTPPGTPVWISVRERPDGVELTVEDAGPGIPPEYRESVFEPFQQVAPVTPHSPGVGVGLSLVRRFAELHGGSAWVDERQGGGASFHVFLPYPASREPGDGPMDVSA